MNQTDNDNMPIAERRTMDSFRELQLKASKMYRGLATWHAKPHPRVKTRLRVDGADD